VCAREALGMVRSAKSNKGNKPTHYGKKIITSSAIAEIQHSKNSFDYWLKIHSIGNKIKILIPLKNHVHNKKFKKWKRNSSVVITDKYIQISYEKETGPKKEVGFKVGIDIGIKKLLVTSEDQIIGDHIETLIVKLNKKKRNSEAWKRCKKEIQYYIDENIKKLNYNAIRLVVVEKLKNLKHKMKVRPRLGRKTRRVITHWNYRYILNRIQMHCEENRVSFRSVNPVYTSVTCSKCNHRDKKNRLSQESFVCTSCGYSTNADYNASKVILSRFITGKYGSCFQT